MALAQVLINALLFALAFTIGRIVERQEWNRLIEQGKIPRPSKIARPYKKGA